MGDRCEGLCCRYFSLGPPERIAEKIQQQIEWGGKAAVDAQKVKDLLIYRGYFTNPHNTDTEPGHWYTCKHFVVDDDYVGYCGIYEDRPYMCRKYPNGDACAYADTGCTWCWAHKPQRRDVDVPVHALTRKKWEGEVGRLSLVGEDEVAAKLDDVIDGLDGLAQHQAVDDGQPDPLPGL